jgi:hypothetical protein
MNGCAYSGGSSSISGVEENPPTVLTRFTKVFHRSLQFQAQKALTAKNNEGYDALTVTNLVINGAWDGRVGLLQDGKLHASADSASFVIGRRFWSRHVIRQRRGLGERQPCA